MQPIRVLHVVPYMGRGGLETMIMNYYRHIDRSKVQFDFLVHREFEADYDKEIKSLGGKIYRLPRLNPFDKKYLDKLEEFFKIHGKEYKIVHSHLDCMAGIPLKYAEKNGVPVRIAHAHSSNQTKDKKYLMKLLFKRNIPQYATNLFACAEDAGVWMFGKAEFSVLNNAIEAEKYRYNKETANRIREELGIKKDSIVIGHVGRFAVPKNHAFIVEVFEQVLEKIPNARLLLVGEGELMGEIKEQVKKKGIEEKVIFTGLRSDVSDVLQAMNLFLFPSIYEGLPVSIVEAQAAGLPCLTSDRVPIESKKTELLEQLALEVSIQNWCEKILEMIKIERRDMYKDIEKAGFDVVANAKWLEDYYINKFQIGRE